MKVVGVATGLVTAQAATLAVTWEDCGAQHAVVTDLQPTSIETGVATTLIGTGTVDEDVTSAQFTAAIKASGVKIASCSGDATTDIECKLPLGAGKITVKAVDFPIAQGEVPIAVAVETSSVIPAQLDKVDVEIRATEQNGEDVICMNVHTNKAAQDPAQPHLAQAWTAQSSGDGMPGAVGDEAYFFYENEAHHMWTYPSGSKLWTCPKGNPSCVAYYLKLNGPNCCKCEDVEKPKQWDIVKPGLFTKVGFTGYEDTTELNDNPVTGAEHWSTSSVLPKVLTVTYDYFLHREESGDVVSHRINFNTSVAQSGEILYGNFEVQHDLDVHRARFAVPQECAGNILNCCDTMDEVDAKWFRHDYALRQAEATVV